MGIWNREQWLRAGQFHTGNLSWEVWALQSAGSGAQLLWSLLLLLSAFLHLGNGNEDSHCVFGSHDNASPGCVPLCSCSVKCLGPGQVSGCPEDHRDMEVGLMTQ